MNFVHGTSSEEEKKLQFRRQSNEEFYTQKKQQQQPKDVLKRTWFKCDQTGHLGRKCPNSKSVDVEKKIKLRLIKQPSLNQNKLGSQKVQKLNLNTIGNQ
ncbi:putative transcription factor interactor and regulator CCHC(Zn) family [Helianthus anomalus]